MNRSSTIAERVNRLSPEQLAWITDQLRLQTGNTETIGQQELVAWIVGDAPADGCAKLRREMSRRLPASWVPRRIIHTRSIPKTSTGKVDRKRLSSDHVVGVVRPVGDDNHASESEQALIRVCRSLLGVAQISPDDNFFHLGGDSLTSIQLISRARQAGIEIEPQDVLHCSSIAELASKSDLRLGKHPSHSTDIVPEDSVVSKVRSSTQTGSTDAATILMVHEVGGRCHYAHYLAAEMDPTHSLYVCNQPAHDDSPRSIEALASLYADDWIRAQPTGPRIIVAFCWGGPLAYEMARQLKSQGEFVQAVLIVESGTEASYRHASRRDRSWDRMKGTLVRIRNRMGSLRNPAGAAQLCVSLLRKLLVSTIPVTADAGFQFRDNEGDPKQIHANVQAFLDYRILPDVLPIHLFRVHGPAGLIGTRYSDQTLGWQYVVGQNLAVHSITGDHDTCMQPPHVSALAGSMNRVIQASGPANCCFAS